MSSYLSKPQKTENGLRITETGLYAISEADYHADALSVTPSLSRSIGQVLLDKSPRHAWTAHPRLNPEFQTDEKNNERRSDIGSAAHALLLGQPTAIHHIVADKYTTKAAQEARKNAYATGAVPLLTPDYDAVHTMVAHAKQQLVHQAHPALSSLARPADLQGEAYNEITAYWQDTIGGMWCRSRMDRLVVTPTLATIIDYKTTEMSASPLDVEKAIFNNAYHLQDGFYRRGLRHVFPQINTGAMKMDFIFIVQEQKAPFEITLVRIDLPGQQIGEKMASAATRLWQQHMQTNDWLGYPDNIHTAIMPAWTETRWLAREIEDPRIANLPYDPLSPYEATPYQAPKMMTELGA